MALLEEVRSGCAAIAAAATWVHIDERVLTRVLSAQDELPGSSSGGPSNPSATPTPPALEFEPAPPTLDPERHYLEGGPADVADYLLALDAINFGSGWFPALNKRMADGRPVSGYFTVAWALTDHVRTHGAPTAAWLRKVSTAEIAAILGQRPDLELMGLYAQALRSLGVFLGERRALDVVGESGGSAERLAERLAGAMALFDDRGFYKRAQIVANDLALAGVAEFNDLDRLTIFADNLVPHVLRCKGVLVYEPELAARIDAGVPLQTGGAEREIRACALHACELISAHSGVAPRVIDNWLWNHGQAPEYKARPRHRCRTVFY
jgi:Potential Queuosine, Q, salvage protein family